MEDTSRGRPLVFYGEDLEEIISRFSMEKTSGYNMEKNSRSSIEDEEGNISRNSRFYGEDNFSKMWCEDGRYRTTPSGTHPTRIKI